MPPRLARERGQCCWARKADWLKRRRHSRTAVQRHGQDDVRLRQQPPPGPRHHPRHQQARLLPVLVFQGVDQPAPTRRRRSRRRATCPMAAGRSGPRRTARPRPGHRRRAFPAHRRPARRCAGAGPSRQRRGWRARPPARRSRGRGWASPGPRSRARGGPGELGKRNLHDATLARARGNRGFAMRVWSNSGAEHMPGATNVLFPRRSRPPVRHHGGSRRNRNHAALPQPRGWRHPREDRRARPRDRCRRAGRMAHPRPLRQGLPARAVRGRGIGGARQGAARPRSRMPTSAIIVDPGRRHVQLRLGPAAVRRDGGRGREGRDGGGADL